VYDPESLTVDTAVWDMPCPVLGICYGMQLMCQNLGGKVEEAAAGEYGRASLNVVKPDSVMFAGVDAESDAWMSHRDRVVAVPEGCAFAPPLPLGGWLAAACRSHEPRFAGTGSRPLAPPGTVHLRRAKTQSARCTGCSFTRR